MSEIGPGDRVLCVGPVEPWIPFEGEEPPTVGTVYTVRDCVMAFETPCILVHEIVNPIYEYAYLGECECPFPLEWFRKWRGNEFDDLLNVRELEDA